MERLLGGEDSLPEVGKASLLVNHLDVICISTNKVCLCLYQGLKCALLRGCNCRQRIAHIRVLIIPPDTYGLCGTETVAGHGDRGVRWASRRCDGDLWNDHKVSTRRKLAGRAQRVNGE